MTSFLLDTNIISETMREKPDKNFLYWYTAQTLDHLFLSSITIAELWQGIRQLDPAHPKRDAYRAGVRLIENQYEDRIFSFDKKTAQLWGALQGERRRTGRPLPDLDLQIAATALQHKLTIVTANTRHFEGMGVPIVNPKQAKTHK